MGVASLKKSIAELVKFYLVCASPAPAPATVSPPVVPVKQNIRIVQEINDGATNLSQGNPPRVASGTLLHWVELIAIFHSTKSNFLKSTVAQYLNLNLTCTQLALAEGASA